MREDAVQDAHFVSVISIFSSHWPILFVQGIIHETKDVNDRLSTINSDKRQLEKEKQEQIKRRTKLELDIKDLQEVAAEDASSKVCTNRLTKDQAKYGALGVA